MVKTLAMPVLILKHLRGTQASNCESRAKRDALHIATPLRMLFKRNESGKHDIRRYPDLTRHHCDMPFRQRQAPAIQCRHQQHQRNQRIDNHPHLNSPSANNSKPVTAWAKLSSLNLRNSLRSRTASSTELPLIARLPAAVLCNGFERPSFNRSTSPRSTNPSTASEKVDFATPRCLATSPCPSATSSLR